MQNPNQNSHIFNIIQPHSSSYSSSNHQNKQQLHSSLPMAKASRIIRQSIFSFLKNYHYFSSSTPVLLLLPFAVSSLLSPSLVSSSYLLPLVRGRLRSLFLAAGFPPSSHLLNFINLKLSQTILTFLFISPFSYSFLLLAKAAIIRSLHHKNAAELHWIQLFKPLLITQLCNSLVILAANSTCFFFLAVCFNCFDVLGLSSSPSSLLLLSAIGAILYSIIIANAYIICNLALVSSAIEKHGGFIAILKACVLIQGRTATATALSLAIPINLALAAIEALFQYRVVGAFNQDTTSSYSAILLEGMLIAYLYAVTLILDTVVGCLFWRSCKTDHRIDHDQTHSHMIEIYVRNDEYYAKSKALDLLP